MLGVWLLLAGASSFHENIAAGAESGWDFSTRWLDEADADFLTIRTQTIVPVDLNALVNPLLEIN